MWYNHGTYWRSRRDWNSFILRTYCLVCYYYYQLEKCFCIPSLIGFDPLEHRLFRVNQLTLEVCYYLLIFTDVSDWRGWGNQPNYGLSTTHKIVTLFPGLVVRIALYTSISRKVFRKSGFEFTVFNSFVFSEKSPNFVAIKLILNTARSDTCSFADHWNINKILFVKFWRPADMWADKESIFI